MYSHFHFRREDCDPRWGIPTAVVRLLHRGNRASLKGRDTRWQLWVKQMCLLPSSSGRLQGGLSRLLVPTLPRRCELWTRALELELPTDPPETPAGPRAGWGESTGGRSTESRLPAAQGTWRGSERTRASAVETLRDREKINEESKRCLGLLKPLMLN